MFWERKITYISKRHPELSRTQIARDLSVAEQTRTPIYAAVRSGEVNVAYAHDILTLADSSPSRKLQRFADALLDHLLN